MEVTVHFHSYFKDLAGRSELTVEIPAGMTLGEVYERLVEQFPKLAPMRNSTLMAVGVEYQPKNYLVKPGDEISFFPPVQGG